MRRLSAEGSFSMAFVPVLAEYKSRHGQAAVEELIDRVAGTLTAFLLVLTAAAVLLAPWIMPLFAPGFGAETEQGRLAAEMLRITFPYALFILLASMAGGILHSYGRFAVPALSPVLMNLSIDRKRVVSGTSVSVRVDLGGRRTIKKNNITPLPRTRPPHTHHTPPSPTPTTP